MRHKKYLIGYFWPGKQPQQMNNTTLPLQRHIAALLVCSLLLFASCDQVTYTFKSKKNIRREKPSVILLAKIVEFRQELNSWPISKEDFMSKGKKYYEALDGFPYTYINFKAIDSNTMVFYFSGHVKDLQTYKETQKVELNTYSGSVKFYKQSGKFVWKMRK
jgi:hypothetical protein